MPAATQDRLQACAHCGTALGGAASGTKYCCAGCQYAARLITESGLGHYYDLRDSVTPPVGSFHLQPRDYAWLVRAQGEAETAAGAPGRSASTAVDLQGMTCIGCVWLVERVFLRQPGALRIEINAQLGRARLTWSAGAFDAAGFARQLQSLGYLLGPPGEKPGAGENSGLARRLGVCAALMMNVMLFRVPSWFGMPPDFAYARLFDWIALLLATLSLLVGGGYFARRAWQGLRAGALHIDLPISLGLGAGYAASLYAFATGEQALNYFDFVATFSFLMLVGRWTQNEAVERNRHRLLSQRREDEWVDLVPGSDASAARRRVADLRPGDRFLLARGRLLPVAALLASEEASLSDEWITGEPEPRRAVRGSRLPAGTCNVSRAPVEVEAREDWTRSALARLLAAPPEDARRNRVVEQVIRWYLPAVLACAAGGTLAWGLGGGGWPPALSVGISVLVISCPCALGTALPLVDELALGLARRAGVFIRRASCWQGLRSLRRVVFDKTGTLTLEAPTLANPEALLALSPQDRAALLALVEESPHPVCRSLHESLLEKTAAPSAGPGPLSIEEQIGLGLLGRDAANTLWTLGRPGWRGGGAAGDSPEAEAEFCREGRPLASFRFTESLRPDAAEEVRALQERGLEVAILSGDRPQKVSAVARQLGLEASAALAALRPEEKAAWVADRDRGDTLMLGDGANDALAFDQAACRGTPLVHRGLLEHRSDFYYLGRGIRGVRALLDIADRRRRTARLVFLFSLAYNLATIAAALCGKVNPIVAAVLMPASSLVTLAIAAWGMRHRERAA